MSNHMDDSATDLGAAGFGLMYYREASRRDNARWYDPVTGRMAQADMVVPRGVQGLDKYAYTNNNPVKYVDPTGHFTEDAIKKYLLDYCEGDQECADALLQQWQADEDWWNMLLAAQAGDILFGMEGEFYTQENGFMYEFQGDGQDVLTGILPYNNQGSSETTLFDIQSGQNSSSASGAAPKGKGWTWIGFVRNIEGTPSFYLRNGYEKTDRKFKRWATDGIDIANTVLYGSILVLLPLGSSAEAWVARLLGGVSIRTTLSISDALNVQSGDVTVVITGPTGSVMFNFQGIPGEAAYSLEEYEILYGSPTY